MPGMVQEEDNGVELIINRGHDSQAFVSAFLAGNQQDEEDQVYWDARAERDAGLVALGDLETSLSEAGLSPHSVRIAVEHAEEEGFHHLDPSLVESAFRFDISEAALRGREEQEKERTPNPTKSFGVRASLVPLSGAEAQNVGRKGMIAYTLSAVVYVAGAAGVASGALIAIPTGVGVVIGSRYMQRALSALVWRRGEDYQQQKRILHEALVDVRASIGDLLVRTRLREDDVGYGSLVVSRDGGTDGGPYVGFVRTKPRGSQRYGLTGRWNFDTNKPPKRGSKDAITTIDRKDVLVVCERTPDDIGFDALWELGETRNPVICYDGNQIGSVGFVGDVDPDGFKLHTSYRGEVSPSYDFKFASKGLKVRMLRTALREL